MQNKILDLGFSWLNIFNGRVTIYLLNNCLNNPFFFFFFHFSVVNKFKSYITLYKNLNNLIKYDLNFKD